MWTNQYIYIARGQIFIPIPDRPQNSDPIPIHPANSCRHPSPISLNDRKGDILICKKHLAMDFMLKYLKAYDYERCVNCKEMRKTVHCLSVNVRSCSSVHSSLRMNNGITAVIPSSSSPCSSTPHAPGKQSPCFYIGALKYVGLQWAAVW